MLIFPAIDLYEGKAVRLLRGAYQDMTIYSENPTEIAQDFKESGARWIHLVDLEGAKDGTTPNLSTVSRIVEASGLSCEIGGGIRSMEVIENYIAAGVKRVILGTAAVEDEAFLYRAVEKYGDQIRAFCQACLLRPRKRQPKPAGHRFRGALGQTPALGANEGAQYFGAGRFARQGYG